MRFDLCNFLHYVLNKNLILLSESQKPRDHLIYVYTTRRGMRRLLALIRLGNLFFGSFFSDITGFDCLPAGKDAGRSISLVYIVFLARWGIKLCMCTSLNNWSRAPIISEFFGGAIWPEREAAELLGINFANKLDVRRLMLDYTFEGVPLSRQFPAIGYEELEYDARLQWLIYHLLKSRDEAELFAF